MPPTPIQDDGEPFSSAAAGELERYDHEDLAATLGALQLIPRNAHQLLRLTLAARALLRLPDQSGPLMSLGRLRRILNEPPIADPQILQLEDPLDDVFAEELVFPIGAFLVSNGTSAEGASILDHIVWAASNGRARLSRDAVVAAIRLAMATVVVIDALLRRAGLTRDTLPQGRQHDAVTVPDAVTLARLKAALSFTQIELNDLLRPHSLDASAVRPLVADSAGEVFLDKSPGTIARPIRIYNSRYVVVSPANLIGAATHEFLATFLRAGEEVAFVKEMAAEGLRSAAWSLDALGFGRGVAAPVSTQTAGMSNAIFGFDSDKVAHVIVVTDDYTGFRIGEVDADWGTESIELELDRLVRLNEEALFSQSGVNAVMHMVIMHPTGRPGHVGVANGASPARSPILAVTSEALRVIAMLEHGERLALWYWTLQRELLQDRGVRIFSWYSLDEYWMYRQHLHSYYLGDGQRPTGIQIGLFGVLEAKAAVRALRDPSGALDPDGNWVEVVRVVTEPDVHTYTPTQLSLTPPLQIRGGVTSLWIVPAASRDPALDGYINELARMMAYWLDRIWAELEGLLTWPHDDRVVINLTLQDHPGWLAPGSSPELPIAETRVDDSNCTIGLNPSLLADLSEASNSGERELMAEVIAAALTVLKHPDPRRAAEAIVDTNIPPSNERSMLIVHPGRDHRLDPTALPPYRPVQDAARAIALDEVGEAMAVRFGVGPAQPDRRTSILNAAVVHLYERMVATVRGCGPSLLPSLLAQHERVISERTGSEAGTISRLRDPRSTEVATKNLSQRVPELSTVSVAMRFLIEYVVARPPIGLRPVSVALLDSLIATASEIVSFGMDSDVIQYGLADTAVSVLPSHRVGVSADAWSKGVGTYFQLNIDARLGEDLPLKPVVSESILESEIFRRGATAEFGMSLSRISELFGLLIGIGESQEQANKHISAASFLTQFEPDGVARTEAQRLYDAFSLGPRPDFMTPDAPYSRPDVYPWRFNRSLSYLRRPLLIVETASGREIWWCNRHLADAMENLVGLCRTGRLKAETSEMAQAIGRQRDAAGGAFSDWVADLIDGYPQFLVKRRVKKVGKSRLHRSDKSDLGDIDVLAADLQHRIVWAVEAKNLAVARTPAELRNEINEIFGSHGTPTSASTKHVERTEWLRSHLSEALAWLGLPQERATRWSVRAVLVTETELLSAHVTKTLVPVISIRQLKRSLDAGWRDLARR